ncbi:porin [Dechloromonas sp. HYN0024]|uniref:porin n=1 Tax=Dechloromonas sp. HYN0024 TaxID=2231055 RepID=UPI000E444194|nr:porin [Dechloromonas sp. HYN0024]AXS80479.1 porin [Dechloromonas sp. HYN0024]
MQKKLIALAIAAATSGAVFAQTNVTIYGNVDMGAMFRQGHNGTVANGQSQYSLQSSSSLSYIGFKGVEDLGNGTKALFDLQYRISPDTSTGLSTAGHQYVGLTGGFGTVVAGYLDGIRYGIYGKYNPFGNYSIGSLTSMTTQYDRAANALAYISPAFAGFTVILATATNTQGAEGSLNTVHSPMTAPTRGNNGDDRLLSANLIYANGPLSIDLDYETTRAVGYDKDRLYVATTGASYDFGAVKVSGVYDVIKGDVNSFIGGNAVGPLLGVPAGQRYDRRNWFVGATVPLGKFSVLGSFGQVKDKTVSNADAWKIGVGARYALSKRTELYADYAHIKNDSAAGYSIGNNIVAGVGVNGLAMGMKHSF